MLADLLSGVPVGDIGLSGLVILAVLMVLTGKLVPKSTLDAERENTATWRTTAERQQEINRVQHDTNSELLTLARASNHALTEIQAVRTRISREGET